MIHVYGKHYQDNTKPNKEIIQKMHKETQQMNHGSER